MIDRLLPRQLDNRYDGSRVALWLLGLVAVLKLMMGGNSLLNAAEVASKADGIPLDTFAPAAAREVVLLFEMAGLGQLVLALLGALALVRYRAMVPLVFLIFLAEHAGRRLIVFANAVEASRTLSPGFYINMGLLALMLIGLTLSLMPRRAALGR
ncbi:MAG: hypothetical protein ACLGHC_03695 [Alphaproteobacteria bacterium]